MGCTPAQCRTSCPRLHAARNTENNGCPRTLDIQRVAILRQGAEDGIMIGAGRRAAVVGAGVGPRVAGCAALCSSLVPSVPGLQRRLAHAGIGVDEEYGIPTVGLTECIQRSGIVERMVSALQGPGYFVETGVLGAAVSTAMREDAVRLWVPPRLTRVALAPPLVPVPSVPHGSSVNPTT